MIEVCHFSVPKLTQEAVDIFCMEADLPKTTINKLVPLQKVIELTQLHPEEAMSRFDAIIPDDDLPYMHNRQIVCYMQIHAKKILKKEINAINEALYYLQAKRRNWVIG